MTKLQTTARIVGCKAITIKRRREMWAEGRELQLAVGKKGSRK